ncbi:SurA N-terminal domain-containing protein [Planococcus sp. FY231025]|uniref:SurA N-terminal domain-containing protein n=1 Tax=Planococcus sp. FY231025 TaxID=3455699 RepID=UPI003F8F2B3D
MIKKMKFIFAPLLIAAVLGACSDSEEAAPKEEKTAETTEETAGERQTALELPEEKDVVAVINDEEVLGNVYNSVARQMESTLTSQGQDPTTPENAKMLKEQAMEVLVGNRLILQDAEEKGHTADDAAVKERLEELKGQFESEEAMNEALEQSGFTLDDMEEQLHDQVTYENYIAKELKPAEVTDKEVQEAYDGYAATAEEAPALEEMEPAIRQSLEQDKTQQAVSKRIEELKKEAKIDVKI